MRKSQINVFLILGILVVIAFIIVVYATTKINEEKVDSELEKIALSPAEISPVRTYVENLLYSVSEEALFEHVGSVTHNNLLTSDQMEQKIYDHIDNEFSSLDLSEFESMGIEISRQGITSIEVNINPNDVTVSLEDPWIVKTKDARNTLSDFRTILFVRLDLVHRVGQYVNTQIQNSQPIDCSYTDSLDSEGYIDVLAETTASGGLVTITDMYTDEFYFNNPFVFKFKTANSGLANCP